MSLLTQLPFYLPSVLVQLVAFAIAAAILPRSRLAAGLLAGGAALQLLASALSFGSYAWTMSAIERHATAAETSMQAGVIGFVASIVRASGELGMIGAAAAGAWLAKPAAPAADPYGFPRP
jgi:hypothetical protein